jgi:hypothetical protein
MCGTNDSNFDSSLRQKTNAMTVDHSLVVSTNAPHQDCGSAIRHSHCPLYLWNKRLCKTTGTEIVVSTETILPTQLAAHPIRLM